MVAAHYLIPTPLSIATAMEVMSMPTESDNKQTSLDQSDDVNNSIGCQTALSYARQDTLVPLTSLLQLVNNSILTVMENIGKQDFLS